MRPGLDLERGLLLLGRIEEPQLDARPYLTALDAMAAEVVRRTESMPPGSVRAQALVDYLAGELGYTGEDGDYHHPDNVYLHRSIVRRRGLPLTLAAIYLFVARRARISAAPVALPGHVVLRFHGHDRNLLIDPFNQGAELSERECLSYLAARGLAFNPKWFADASDAKMFERQVRNLCVSYRRRGLEREVRLIARILFARRSASIEAVPEAAR
jgi:regulator of sirC expression with transglutaminase-like and TPR domain